jgi:phosphatidate cytidylyltransferase
MTLTPGAYAYQFTQFCWTHMTLLLVVFQAHFIINSIFEGLIWFFLPVCLVITNDIFAYICGMIWGRTPLIRLSPKKTVEGFIGGWICTIIIGGGIAWFLAQYKYMICPVKVPFLPLVQLSFLGVTL